MVRVTLKAGHAYPRLKHAFSAHCQRAKHKVLVDKIRGGARNTALMCSGCTIRSHQEPLRPLRATERPLKWLPACQPPCAVSRGVAQKRPCLGRGLDRLNI